LNRRNANIRKEGITRDHVTDTAVIAETAETAETVSIARMTDVATMTGKVIRSIIQDRFSGEAVSTGTASFFQAWNRKAPGGLFAL
jgi:hypothetical protein